MARIFPLVALIALGAAWGALTAHAQDQVEEGIAEDTLEDLSADEEVSLTLDAPEGSDAPEDVSLPEGDIGKYVVIPKASGRDWAILLDTQTGQTWRLGQRQPGSRWAWIPIGVCADCR